MISSAETIQCPFQNMNATLISIFVVKSQKLITNYKSIHFQEILYILDLNKQFLYGILEPKTIKEVCKLGFTKIKNTFHIKWKDYLQYREKHFPTSIC